MATLRSTIAVSLATLAALAMTACNDGSGEPSDEPAGETTLGSPSGTSSTDTAVPELPEPTGEAADAEIAVRDFYRELGAGELESACGWWTEEYAATSVERWNATGNPTKVRTCPQLLREVTKTVAIVGEPSELFAVTAVSGELVGDDAATVQVTLASADEPETYQLTRTAVGWRISGDEAGELSPSESPEG